MWKFWSDIIECLEPLKSLKLVDYVDFGHRSFVREVCQESLQGFAHKDPIASPPGILLLHRIPSIRITCQVLSHWTDFLKKHKEGFAVSTSWGAMRDWRINEFPRYGQRRHIDAIEIEYTKKHIQLPLFLEFVTSNHSFMCLSKAWKHCNLTWPSSSFCFLGAFSAIGRTLGSNRSNISWLEQMERYTVHPAMSGVLKHSRAGLPGCRVYVPPHRAPAWPPGRRTRHLASCPGGRLGAAGRSTFFRWNAMIHSPKHSNSVEYSMNIYLYWYIIHICMYFLSVWVVWGISVYIYICT